MLKWWWLWQDVSLTHLLTPPTSSHSSPSRTLPWPVHPHYDFGSVGSSRTGPGRFWPHADIPLHPHELLKTPTNCKIASFLLCVHPRTKTELFFLTQGLHCLFFSLLGQIVYPRTGILLFGGAHSELRAVLLHPQLSVKGHSRFWLSHRLFGSFFPCCEGCSLIDSGL